jgi:hypothetical protein
MRYFQPPADARFYAGVDLHARSLFLRGSATPNLVKKSVAAASTRRPE